MSEDQPAPAEAGTSSALAERRGVSSPPAMTDVSPSGLLSVAVERGASIEQLHALMELQERWERREAEKAYSVAFSEFQARLPSVQKTKHVRYVNGKGQTVEYWHADLAELARVVGDAMAQHGLSFRWHPKVDGKDVVVTCVVQHELGHTESVSLPGAPDTSGSKNGLQSIGSTIRYLQRYTLESITGIIAGDDDDDGRGAGADDVIDGDDPNQPIDAETAEDFKNRLHALSADPQALLGIVRRKWKLPSDAIRSIDELPRYAETAVRSWIADREGKAKSGARPSKQQQDQDAAAGGEA
jgi:hypothetical protein